MRMSPDLLGRQKRAQQSGRRVNILPIHSITRAQNGQAITRILQVQSRFLCFEPPGGRGSKTA